MLFVTFSESILPESLTGSSLLLVTGTGETELNIINAAMLGDTVRIEVSQSTLYTIAANDSLRINPQGNAVDMYNNRAHLDNRPVVIQLRLIPSEIDSAFYYDNTPDGIVDQAVLYFSSSVELSQISMVFNFDGVNSPALSSAKFKYVGNDSSIVGADLTGLYSDLGIKTSGPMHVVVSYAAFPGEDMPGLL